MSHHVVSEVYKRQVGKMPRVPLLALMADKASDDGRGIWASKQTLADELGCSKQTVITTVDNLIADGLLIVVGDRACSNGHTVEYRIDIDALEALPLVGCHARKASKRLTGQKSGPVKNLDPTGQKSGPDQSKVLTQTFLEPSLNQEPPNPLGRGKRASGPIPDDWVLTGIDDLPPSIGGMARQWPAGAYQAEGEAFRQHWRGRGTKRPDWAACWAARVQMRHESVMRMARQGVAFVGAVAAAGALAVSAVSAKGREDGRSAALQAALREKLGDSVWQRWLAPCAILFEPDALVVIAPSAFHADQLARDHVATIEAVMGAGALPVVVRAEKAPKRRGAGVAAA